MYIEPISEMAQSCIVSEVDRYLALLRGEFDHEFLPIPIRFDIVGRSAGMYRVRSGSKILRFNPYLFAKYWPENFAITVPHEVAHYATDLLFGSRRIKPHGREWRAMMKFFDADSRVTCDFDLSGIPVRRMRRFNYTCRCDSHELSAVRHNRISRGRQRYFCRRCRSELKVPEEANFDSTGNEMNTETASA